MFKLVLEKAEDPEIKLPTPTGSPTEKATEFQRRARTDKKAFLSEQCKEVEGNNRMERTRDLFKKIGDIKGTFHARTGMIKDRNSKDLTEAEEIEKRGQEYTEELYKKRS